MADPALALLEFDSLAAGIDAGDAMVKRSPVALLRAGSVQPGRYLVLVSGQVADVDEALAAGRERHPPRLRDVLYLPNVHPGVVDALRGARRRSDDADALGVVETSGIAAAIRAADAGLKGAEVTLWHLRLGDGLGGKGLVLFAGLVADAATAVDLGAAAAGAQLAHQVVIPQLHDEMRENVAADGRFGTHYDWPPH